MHLSSEGKGREGGIIICYLKGVSLIHFILCDSGSVGAKKFPALDQIAMKCLNGLGSLSKTINFY